MHRLEACAPSISSRCVAPHPRGDDVGGRHGDLRRRRHACYLRRQDPAGPRRVARLVRPALPRRRRGRASPSSFDHRHLLNLLGSAASESTDALAARVARDDVRPPRPRETRARRAGRGGERRSHERLAIAWPGQAGSAGACCSSAWESSGSRSCWCGAAMKRFGRDGRCFSERPWPARGHLRPRATPCPRQKHTPSRPRTFRAAPGSRRPGARPATRSPCTASGIRRPRRRTCQSPSTTCRSASAARWTTFFGSPTGTMALVLVEPHPADRPRNVPSPSRSSRRPIGCTTRPVRRCPATDPWMTPVMVRLPPSPVA